MDDLISTPYNKDAENALIGALLINPDTARSLVIEPSDFYIIRNQFIYEAIMRLIDRNEIVDFVTLTNELELQGRLAEIGGPAYITGMINDCPSSLHAEQYATIIKLCASRRHYIRVANDIVNAAYAGSDDLQQVVLDAASALTTFSQPKKAARHISKALTALLDDIAEKVRAKEAGEVSSSILTGFIDLDAYTGGLQKGEVFYLAGEPGAGKSKLMLQIGLQAALPRNGGRSVAIYSLEMSELAVIRRLISGAARISTRHLRSGDLEADEWAVLVNEIGNLSPTNLFVSDASELTINELRADIVRLKAQNNGELDLVLVDYLFLMSGFEKLDDTERSARISKGLRVIAKEENVSLIVVNSVVKEGMDASSLAALKKNLRGSGQLIHDADLIAFIIPPSDEQSQLANRTNIMPLVKLIFVKARDLEQLATIELLADNHYPIFHSAVQVKLNV